MGLIMLIDGLGSQDITLLGMLMLIWSCVSRFAYRKNPDKPIAWIQSLWYSIVFVISIIACSVFIAYFPNMIANGILNPYITILVMILFLIFLFV